MDADGKMIVFCNNRGFALIWLALLIPVVLLFAAMAVDFSYMYVTKGQLQNAADSAALAGAARLIRDDGLAPTFNDMTGARNSAVTFARANAAAGLNVVIDKNNDISFGFWDVHYTVNGTPLNAIEVRAARDSNSASGLVTIRFGRFFGWDRMAAGARAIAAIPARATSAIAMCPDFCHGPVSANVLQNYTTASSPPLLMNTGPSTPSPNIYAWTSYTSNVTSSSDVRDLICNQSAISQTSCNGMIYSSMGTQASSLCNLEAQMYNPGFDSDNKDYVAKGINTTGWWLVVPITQSCPPGAQGNAWDPKAVIGYAKVHILAICTNGCGSGSIKAPCTNYSAPSGACNRIETKYGFGHNALHNVMVIDKLWCVDCASSKFFGGRRPILVSE